MLCSSTLRLCSTPGKNTLPTSYQAIPDHRHVSSQPPEHYPTKSQATNQTKSDHDHTDCDDNSNASDKGISENVTGGLAPF